MDLKLTFVKFLQKPNKRKHLFPIYSTDFTEIKVRIHSTGFPIEVRKLKLKLIICFSVTQLHD